MLREGSDVGARGLRRRCAKTPKALRRSGVFVNGYVAVAVVISPGYLAIFLRANTTPPPMAAAASRRSMIIGLPLSPVLEDPPEPELLVLEVDELPSALAVFTAG